MGDELFQMITSINDVHRAGVLAGAEFEHRKLAELEAENRELKEHIRHLEDSLAVALGEKMGLKDAEKAAERIQVEADHRRELSLDPQRVPIVGPVKS